MTTKPSSNWLALKNSLLPRGHRRTHRKSDRVESSTSFSHTASPFPRDGSKSLRRSNSESSNQYIDLETTEVKNGESIAALRRMVLGKVEYKESQTASGKYLALDCEMVGVGIDGSESSLARVSVVNYAGAVVLDAFVRQRERVVDYRTQWSGVRSTDLAGSARPFNEVQKTVADLIKDRILVGHAVYNDLKALLLSHPSPQLRDTQSLAYKYRVVKSRHPALRVLVKQELGIVIQGGEHSSVTDARATMALFRLYKKQWESGFRPSHVVAHPRSRSHDTTGGTSEPPQLSLLLPSSVGRDKKRKRSLSSEPDNDHMEGATKASKLPSRPHAHVPALSSVPHTQPPSISTLPEDRKQRSKSQLPRDGGQRKGISSGMSTVIKRADGKKEILRNNAQLRDDGGNRDDCVRKGSKGRKSEGKVEWWKSLGGGKKGSIRL